MQHIPKSAALQFNNGVHCSVYEYATEHPGINIGVAEIRGRYPDSGWAMNKECTEMGYVLEGSGKLVTGEQTAILAMGDVVLIPNGEKYYWEGHMKLLLPATPAWYPEQHVRVG